MLHFSGAARNEVFRRCPRWHYLAALILTHVSNSLPSGMDGSGDSDGLATVSLATATAAACAVDFAGNLELLVHLLSDAL